MYPFALHSPYRSSRCVLATLLGLLVIGCPSSPKPETGQRETGGGETSVPDTSPPHTGDTAPVHTGETGAGHTGDTGDPDPPVRVCDDAWLTAPADIPAFTEYWKTSDNLLYRVVQVESDLYDPLYLGVFVPADPSANAWVDGAPVAVVARNPTETPAFLLDRFGFVEVQPMYDSFMTVPERTVGPANATGMEYAEAYRQAVRFAAGVTTTVEGWTIGQVAGRPVCGPGVVLLSGSSGAATLWAALDAWHEELVPLSLGIGAYEPPSVVEFMTGDAGWVWRDARSDYDADGNGFAFDDFRNPAWLPGSCPASSPTCLLDYSGLAITNLILLHWLLPWKYELAPGAEVVLYLDRNGNGALDLSDAPDVDLDGNEAIDGTEDYYFTPEHDAEAEPPLDKQFYSPALLAAAVDAGLLDPADWPKGMASPDEADAYWTAQNPLPHALSVAPRLAGSVPVVLSFTEVDHGVGLGTHPHVWLLYETLRRQGVTVRLNASQVAFDCVAGLGEKYLEGIPAEPDLAVAEEEMHAFSVRESIPVSFSWGLPALEIAWSQLGPFDRCAGLDL